MTIKYVESKKMGKSYIVENKQSRARLIKTVNSLSNKELQFIIYKEGWTIAVALGHIAFWDQRRCELAKRWRKNQIKKSDITGLDMDTVNDALVTIFLAMPARKIAELSIKSAEAVDKEIAGLTAEQTAKIEKIWNIHALNRGLHRKMHLDEIEVLLKDKRGKK
jgi:hypothetical protein